MSHRNPLAAHVAYCGLDCSGCDVFQATAWNDDGLRQAYADKVFKSWKLVVEPATLNCHGCRDERPKSGFCATCHSYAGVTLDCFECHADKPAAKAAVTASGRASP